MSPIRIVDIYPADSQAAFAEHQRRDKHNVPQFGTLLFHLAAHGGNFEYPYAVNGVLHVVVWTQESAAIRLVIYREG